MNEGKNVHQAKTSVQPAQSQQKCVNPQKCQLHVDDVTTPAAVDICL